jgi:hypothetical protein
MLVKLASLSAAAVTTTAVVHGGVVAMGATEMAIMEMVGTVAVVPQQRPLPRLLSPPPLFPQS